MISSSGCMLLMRRDGLRTMLARAIGDSPSALAPATSSIPIAIVSALTDHVSKVAIDKRADIGRALVAAGNLDYGSTIFSERPIVCYPNPKHSETVCFNCLKVLLSTSALIRSSLSGRRFCSEACCSQAERLYHHAEALAASSDDCSLRAFEASCDSEGERFPLMVARLAFTRLSQAARVTAGIAQAPNAPLDPAIVSGDPLDVSFLCFANITKPYPPRWIGLYTLLSKALGSSVDLIEQQMGLAKGQSSLLRSELEGMDLEWFVSTLSRLHLNTFRVGCLIPPTEALEVGGQIGPSTTTSGSATYLLGSLLNHSCEPNVEPVFRRQDATVSFVATRDIDKGEPLFVSYLDETLPFAQRQEHLLFSYGFKCRCFKCAEGI